MKIKTRDLVAGALLLAIGVLIPAIFHITGINGSIFSPMHIPVLLAGFIVGPFLGLIVGVLTPLLNFLILGMPPIPILFVMMIELGFYGLVSGLIYKSTRSIIISLVSSMILGRLGGALAAYILSTAFGFQINAVMFLKSATILAWPAILLHIVLIPILLKAVNRSRR